MEVENEEVTARLAQANQMYKLGDCSKQELLRRLRESLLTNQYLNKKMLNVATGFQAMCCELRIVDKENCIFDEESGVIVVDKQIEVIDKFIKNGEYDVYREARKKEHQEYKKAQPKCENCVRHFKRNTHSTFLCNSCTVIVNDTTFEGDKNILKNHFEPVKEEEGK